VQLLILCSLVATARPLAAADPPATVDVRIVPMRIRPTGERTLTLPDAAQHFYVVLTNVGARPLRLWREWCSFGYYNLSFEVTDEQGKIIKVTKKPRAWDKNYPDWTLVPPGDHLVFEVTLDESTWQPALLPPHNQQAALLLRAVFEIPDDRDSKRYSVWTGRVTSSVDAYTIYR
jgi:hypothetical protein